MSAITNILLLAIIVAGTITACDDRSEREQREHAARRTAERSLMTDISRATPEIERRLRERVQSNGTIAFVKDNAGGRFFSLQAMPATVRWTADCGLVGLSVSFGDTGENGNGTEIRLSDVSFDEAACRMLLPIAAAKVGKSSASLEIYPERERATGNVAASDAAARLFKGKGIPNLFGGGTWP